MTDLGLLEKQGDLATSELVLTAVPPGDASVADRVAAAQAACGWDLAVAPDVSELKAPTKREVDALRRWDPRGWFLRAR